MKINVYQNYLQCSLKIRGLRKGTIYQTSIGRKGKKGKKIRKRSGKMLYGILLTVTVEARK